MKKTIIILAAALVSFAAAAQEPSAAQVAAEEAAQAINEAAQAEPAKPKFSDFWTESLKTNLTFGQTSLTNWAAGGDNTFTLAAHADGNANYKKDLMFWNNRLQLDYGFLWASSKPITQKNNDRIYLESKWGYQIKDKLFFSASYDFKSQFTTGYNYKTPTAAQIEKANGGTAADLEDLSRKVAKQAWKDARDPKSDILSPAYTTLALGIDWKPKDWFSLSVAPLTGGYTIVMKEPFRKAYGMDVKKEWADYDEATATEEQKAAYAAAAESGSLYKGARFEFGAQVKMDLKAQINEAFTYTTQLVLFENYLKDHKAHPCPRINWDNRIDWKLAKYFALTVTTNMIYDDFVMIKTDKWASKCAKDEAYKAANPDGVRALQFMESLSFGFTYTIASKK